MIQARWPGGIEYTLDGAMNRDRSHARYMTSAMWNFATRPTNEQDECRTSTCLVSSQAFRLVSSLRSQNGLRSSAFQAFCKRLSQTSS